MSFSRFRPSTKPGQLHSAAGLHAALGGPGSDTLYGGFGPAILAGGDGSDTLTGRNADDELYGQGGNDILYGNGGNDKGFGGDGNDSISLGEGNNEADGGPGNDTLNTGGGTDILRGGPGNDVLNAGGGDDDLRGNAGDDTLNGGSGDDVLVGGPGKDIINAGSGDDTVIVYDVCELVAGEVYNGDGGNDTLQIPVPLADVQALGVVVNGFENVVVQAPQVFDATPPDEISECYSCGCEILQDAVQCCSGHGVCDAVNQDGAAFCACDPGFVGPACNLAAGTVYEPRDCPADDPSCEAPAFSVVEALDFDLTANPICDDLPGVADQVAGHDGMLRTVLYHPAVSDVDPAWPAGQFPVVIFVHGNGQGYTYYEDLMSFMAGNQLATVSIEADLHKSVGTRAHLQVCVRRLLPGIQDVAQHVEFDRMAFAGHSRGGEATVIAANLWAAESPMEAASAVAALAPSLNCDPANSTCPPPGEDGAEFLPLTRLGDEAAAAYLTLLGSHDGDVPVKGLELYELASDEHVPAPPYMHKTNAYVFQVPHNDWGGIASTSNTPAKKGNVLAREYLAGFLRWRLNSQGSLRELFTSQALPPCLLDPGQCGYEDFSPVELFNQYLEGTADGGGRRVIFDFTSEIIPGATFGVTQPATAEPVLVDTSNLPFSDPLRTAALRVTWLQDATVDLEFPAPLDSFGGSFLGFRLSKPFNGTVDPCEILGDVGPLAFNVILEDANAVSGTVAGNDFGTVTDPIHPDTGPGNAVACAYDFFQTFRVPLAEFAAQGVDVTQIARISFALPAQSGVVPAKLLLDTVEFTGSPADADCGNGLVEAGEECDDGDLDDEDACKSDCIPNVCGDGVLNPFAEDCDDGNLMDGDGCDAACNLECDPGTPLCRCFDPGMGEANPDLPNGGILGDGRWCLDDVTFNGNVRCVDPPVGEPYCWECTAGEGVWCPCMADEGCFADAEGLEGPATGTVGDSGICQWAGTEGFPQIPAAGGLGYCFVEGEPDPLEGGTPSWFFDNYCLVVHEDLVCAQEFNEPRVCQADPGPVCLP